MRNPSRFTGVFACVLLFAACRQTPAPAPSAPASPAGAATAAAAQATEDPAKAPESVYMEATDYSPLK